MNSLAVECFDEVVRLVPFEREPVTKSNKWLVIAPHLVASVMAPKLDVNDVERFHD